MRFTDRGSGVPIERAAPPVTVPDACSACGTSSAARLRACDGGIELVLCTDADACCDRYRGHTSPESYAAALRGELLGVAP